MTPPAARLLLVVHGTRSAAGRRVCGRLLLEVRKALPGVDARLAFVDVQRPTVAEALADGVPTVVVPAFLAAGYHVRHDVPLAADGAPGPVVVTAHLGSGPRVRTAVVQRLAEAGAVPGVTCDALVLGVAGSRDEDSRRESRELGREIARVTGSEVAVGFAAGAEPRAHDVVAELRDRGARRIALATVLLAPGFFADRLRVSGADIVSEPLGVHPEMVRLVVERYRNSAEWCILGTTPAHPAATNTDS